MTQTDPNPTDPNPTDPNPNPTDPNPNPAPTDRTFTQAELDRIVQDRLARERGKFGDYDDLKAKAAKLDELEAANQTELERERAAREQAERERDELKAGKRDAARRAAILAEASKAGAADPELVAELLASSAQVTIDDAGTVTGHDTAVAALLEQRPILKGARFTPGGADGGTRSPADPTDLGSLTMEEYHKRRAAERAAR